ncbi:hypothetical protein CLAUR_010860 [Clostridium felsineum]|nr:hypothetical protein CLAUR_010860 [Clostridium felsineum]
MQSIIEKHKNEGKITPEYLKKLMLIGVQLILYL